MSPSISLPRKLLSPPKSPPMHDPYISQFLTASVTEAFGGWQAEEGEKNSWGHPQTPGRETPAPPYGEGESIGGHPQTPGRGNPAPLRENGEREELGDTPKPPAESTLHPVNGIAGETPRAPAGRAVYPRDNPQALAGAKP